MWRDTHRPLLIIAASGRALAQSALRAGRVSLVIDAFGDEDTRRAAAVSAVARLGRGGFEPDSLHAALARLGQGRGTAPLLYGSGLEAQPELIAEVASGRTLFGNPPEVAQLVRRPGTFFALLDSLGIAHPPTRTGTPLAGPGWLAKDARGSGGVHVRPWNGRERIEEGVYLQQRLSGQAMSLLFLADGRRSHPLGFNTLWTADEPAAPPYAFGGFVNRAALRPVQRAGIGAAAGALTRVLGLRGLNCLDFMLAEDGDWRVLELNARPGASFSLYDRCAANGLVDLHIRAFEGGLPRLLCLPAPPPRAQRVVYAALPTRIPPGMGWPAWTADRPAAGRTIGAGEPICSVLAEGGDRATVERLVRIRRRQLLRRLEPQREIA